MREQAQHCSVQQQETEVQPEVEKTHKQSYVFSGREKALKHVHVLPLSSVDAQCSVQYHQGQGAGLQGVRAAGRPWEVGMSHSCQGQQQVYCECSALVPASQCKPRQNIVM